MKEEVKEVVAVIERDKMVRNQLYFNRLVEGQK